MSKLDVLLMFDVNTALPPETDFAEDFTSPEKHFETEGDVARTLRDLGHTVRTHPVFDDLGALVNRLTHSRPELVFNLTECFHFRRQHEPHLAGLLEMLRIPHTGVGATGLSTTSRRPSSCSRPSPGRSSTSASSSSRCSLSPWTPRARRALPRRPWRRTRPARWSG